MKVGQYSLLYFSVRKLTGNGGILARYIGKTSIIKQNCTCTIYLLYHHTCNSLLNNRSANGLAVSVKSLGAIDITISMTRNKQMEISKHVAQIFICRCSKTGLPPALDTTC